MPGLQMDLVAKPLLKNLTKYVVYTCDPDACACRADLVLWFHRIFMK